MNGTNDLIHHIFFAIRKGLHTKKKKIYID